MIVIEIEGYCQPKQRTKWKFVTPPETRAYEALVATYARLAMKGRQPLEGPIGVDMKIVCAIPKHFTKKKQLLAFSGQIRPTFCDCDNQIKAVCDGLNGVVYDDDRQINALSCHRRYGERDYVVIWVYSLVASTP